jgi:hypothetical protein
MLGDNYTMLMLDDTNLCKDNTSLNKLAGHTSVKKPAGHNIIELPTPAFRKFLFISMAWRVTEDVTLVLTQAKAEGMHQWMQSPQCR